MKEQGFTASLIVKHCWEKCHRNKRRAGVQKNSSQGLGGWVEPTVTHGRTGKGPPPPPPLGLAQTRCPFGTVSQAGSLLVKSEDLRASNIIVSSSRSLENVLEKWSPCCIIHRDNHSTSSCRGLEEASECLTSQINLVWNMFSLWRDKSLNCI